MAKTYIVELTEAEEANLIELTTKGQCSARRIKRVNILLLADKGKFDEEIADALQTSISTVVRTRQKFVVGNLDFALGEQSRSGRVPKLTDKVEAILMTIAQSVPPEGRRRWTLKLLTDRLVTLTQLDSISYESVRLALKKIA